MEKNRTDARHEFCDPAYEMCLITFDSIFSITIIFFWNFMILNFPHARVTGSWLCRISTCTKNAHEKM